MTEVQDLTPDRLTELLAGATGGAVVASVDATTIGTGQMATCVRLELGYAPGDAGPASVIAKLPSLDPDSRAAAQALRCYEIEVEFYRRLRRGLAVRTPEAYHAEIDVAETDFLLVMEDVSPARQGDQLAGCSFEQAAAAVAEMAGLHAPRWGDRRLEEFEWLHRNTELTRGNLPELVRLLYPGFVERYSDRLDTDVRAVADRLVAGMDGLDTARRGPWTVTHGDFRLDNLLFQDDPGALVYVVDWQTAVLGPGVADLSYFVGSAFGSDLRRRHEEDLVRLYQEHMGRAGVTLEWPDLWRQYRRHSFGGLIMAIAASMLVERTVRGDDMFMAMADRHGHHAIDMDAVTLLG